MSSINKRRFVLFVILLVLGLLLLQVIRGYSQPAVLTDGSDAVETNIFSAISGTNNVVMESIDFYDTIIRRPLFVISRSNVVAETQVIEQVSKKPPPLVLIGVVITPDIKSALFRNTGSSEILSIKSSDEFQGWKLTEIEHNRVVFQKDERNHEILLQQQDSPKSITKSQPRRK